MIVHLQGGEGRWSPAAGQDAGRNGSPWPVSTVASVFTRAQWTKFLGCHTEKVRRAVFVYADPGYETTTAHRSWGAPSGRR